MNDASYALLTVLADTLDGLEKERKAAENRFRSFTAVPLNEFDTAKGFADTPEAILLEGVFLQLQALESDVIKKLEAATLAHPVAGPFVEAHKGIGAKGVGRLVGAVGDPAWNWNEDRLRRGPAELWAFCGFHTVDAGGHVPGDFQPSITPGVRIRPRRQRGVKLNWSTRAKTAAWNVAEAAYRQGDYRPIYVTAREVAKDKTHGTQCQNRVRPPGKSNGCGTGAHPEWGEPGSPWRPGHQHQHAHSLVSKAILKDLYVLAREAHS